jgi:hypothetical protein
VEKSIGTKIFWICNAGAAGSEIVTCCAFMDESPF